MKCENLPKTLVKTCSNDPLDVDLSSILLKVYSVENLSMTVASTTHTYTLPSGTKSFEIWLEKGNANFNLDIDLSGDTEQFSHGSRYFKEKLDPTLPHIIYLSSNKDNDIATITTWQ